jgi:ParB family chromosome partitioning protein
MSTVSSPVRPGVFACPAADIDAGGAWLFWSLPPSPALRLSLERHGQLVPVLVDGSGSRPVLLAGAARVGALAELGREVLCLDLGAVEGLARGLVYVQSNLGRELTDGQIVAAIRYFSAEPRADLGPALEALGLEPRSKRLRLVRSWLALPRRWDRLLAAGNVPLACAELLEGLGPGDLDAVEPLFADLSWSRGNAVNVLTWLREICVRDASRAAEVLADCGTAGLLGAGLSPKDAMARVTQEVRRRRYPLLSAMERDFSDAARQLTAGTRWRLAQPDCFESDVVEIGARLGSVAELRAASAELARIAEREDLAVLFPPEKP